MKFVNIIFINIIVVVFLFSGCLNAKRIITDDSVINIDNSEYLLINLPPESDENTGVIMEKIFYSSGAKFTALLLNGNNSFEQSVSWKISENEDDRTTINNGILTVARADHGKSLMLTATSTENNISSIININAVICFPSFFYGIWTWEADTQKTTVIFSEETYEMKSESVDPNNPITIYHYIISIDFWSPTEWGITDHPGGYTIYGKLIQIPELYGSSDFKIGDTISASFYPMPENNSFYWLNETNVFTKKMPTIPSNEQ